MPFSPGVLMVQSLSLPIVCHGLIAHYLEHQIYRGRQHHPPPPFLHLRQRPVVVSVIIAQR